MLIILLIFLIISLIGIKYKNNNEEYLSINQTLSIRGFFAIIIFFSHFNQYINLSNNFMNNSYIFIISKIGQLMVSEFFFFSGYGIIKSMINKIDYMNNFIKNRFLKIFLNFEFIILLFLIFNIITNKTFELSTIFLSFTGWESIGNSNWYVFTILVLYLIVFLLYKIFNKKINNLYIFTLFIITFIFVIILYFLKENYWYNILLTFPFGVLYGYNEDKIKNLISKKYYLLCVIIALLFSLTYITNSFILYELRSIFFVLLITLFSYKFIINNKILLFLGKYSFEIYLLQRIPDMIFINIKNNYIYFVVSLLTTIIISILFNKTFNYYYNLIIKKRGR